MKIRKSRGRMGEYAPCHHGMMRLTPHATDCATSKLPQEVDEAVSKNGRSRRAYRSGLPESEFWAAANEAGAEGSAPSQ